MRKNGKVGKGSVSVTQAGENDYIDLSMGLQETRYLRAI
jgi:hypothetical protein